MNRPFPSLKQMPLNTKPIVVGDLTMTNHRVENGRRNFLLIIAGGFAGLAAGCPRRVLPKFIDPSPASRCYGVTTPPMASGVKG